MTVIIGEYSKSIYYGISAMQFAFHIPSMQCLLLFISLNWCCMPYRSPIIRFENVKISKICLYLLHFEQLVNWCELNVVVSVMSMASVMSYHLIISRVISFHYSCGWGCCSSDIYIHPVGLDTVWLRLISIISPTTFWFERVTFRYLALLVNWKLVYMYVHRYGWIN